MARTYNEMVQLVRDWSNRDLEALPDPIIQDSLRWAADKAYRTLRVPPLENTLYYSAAQLEAATSSTNNRFASVTELGIPEDLVEFIQIRGVDSEGRTTRMFNEKADVRTFNDLYAEKYNDSAFWTRQGNCILLSPGFGNAGNNYGSTGVGSEDGIEIYYYRRLPALNAVFEPSAANFNALPFALPNQTPVFDNNLGHVIPIGSANAFLTVVETGGTLLYTTGYRNAAGQNFIVAAYPTEEARDAAQTRLIVPDNTVANPSTIRVEGMEIPNWLRDENERVVLMGALAEVFFYLQEDDQAQKYSALFQQEIQELNNEDVMRNASGGNVQMNFNGRGLI